jgi:tRNA(Met) cytidine acetyltransferase
VPNAIEFYQQLKKLSLQTNHRQLCCLQGTQSWCIKQSTTIINAQESTYHWCGEAPPEITTSIYSALLGQEIRLLILNMMNGFDANMFAAAEGSVCGGSVIIMLLPSNIIPASYFDQYIYQQLLLHEFPIWIEGQPQPIFNYTNSTYQNGQTIQGDSIPQDINSSNLSEQMQAVEKIISTATGHSRRPLVITANRGRGKSAALGIAAANLINQGLTTILVCAPNKQAVTTLYKHAQLTIKNKEELQRIQFIAPDTLSLQLPSCDLLIIDEAAAIPIKLLTQFTHHYSRVVFATTQFGYEGSGRGFKLRFQEKLTQIAPEWKAVQLHSAIRWAENDPVEAFTLNSLCLMENVQPLITAEPLYNTTISIIDKETLLQDTALLKQLFSLLVNAHYQTKPSDFSALLNDKDLTIIAMQQNALQDNKHVLGVALINHEGGLDERLCEQIHQGKRRPSGHLVAQSLTFHSGFVKAGTHQFARIQRIAIQPSLQNKSLGSKLLEWVTHWAKEQQFDHLCASFAASEPILRFWLRHNLTVLRIGIRKDKSSGQHSFIVNLPLNEQGKQLHDQIQTEFNKQVKLQLSRQLSHIEPSLISTLWSQIITIEPCEKYGAILSAYIDANRSYENVEYLLLNLLMRSSLEALNKKQQACLIEKTVQNHSWQEIVQQHGFTGQKQAQAFIKNCICDLLAHSTT